ncbi:hypothetical protein J525_0654 [Acinetobacter sp. 21871]|nr:hypothetical protein J525_0654 [Acinetobacter sp. 21871]
MRLVSHLIFESTLHVSKNIFTNELLKKLFIEIIKIFLMK